MRLSRGQKVLRNLLLGLLLCLAAYAMAGFPPYTVEAMLDRAEQRYLLNGLEPVLVKREKHSYSNELFPRHTTFLLARSGDTYLWTHFDRHLLEVEMEARGRNGKLCRGALCTAWDGTLYIAGSFEEVVSARIEVTAEKVTQVLDPDTQACQVTVEDGRTFAYEGERVSGALFTCRYHPQGERVPWYGDGTPEEEYTLAAAACNWYRGYVVGSSGTGLLHADLPVRVTLCNAAGEVLDILELSVETYELYSAGF